MSRRQLSELGLSRRAIQHRVARGRLHPVMRGVYAVGRPELDRRGRWMAAVLCCGEIAVLSQRSAAAHWGIAAEDPEVIEVSVLSGSYIRRPGIRVHRRSGLGPTDLRVRDGIPLTGPAQTIVDLAGIRGGMPLERAINAADRLDLVDPEGLRLDLARRPGQAGVARQRFLRLVSDAGLPLPLTRRRVNGFLVDFHWPDLGLVVETDGLRYHRTPSQQARDKLRDQAHTAAGLATLRFTHAQVRFDPRHVKTVLRAVVSRLAAPNGGGS